MLVAELLTSVGLGISEIETLLGGAMLPIPGAMWHKVKFMLEKQAIKRPHPKGDVCINNIPST